MTRPVRIHDTPASRHDDDEPRVVEPASDADLPRNVVMGATSPVDPRGIRRVEVIADGWRFEFEVEDAGRAELRERASRDRDAHAGAGGPLEIHAIIPGRVASVAVVAGDEVEAGQTLLVVEAMKMQNELRAPRSGTVTRVAVAAGATVELGDLLVVLG